ncbi:hypothetical protein O0I10_012870 [Lichtheimia ornata]|uniref:Uncharacterized protein n=1 Tax=Lichtheimia ornata TaxID=688661 RepID=A0AAD7XVE7_9FUNG|nr:uncharacterized protein O0I10_012870 [Lichtheimia ornata]KAJ8651562.1 hypothetical protein O0I10_012870 [Lichtheimia ornata]
MHNLYSGTAKRSCNLWKAVYEEGFNKPLLSNDAFLGMVESTDDIVLPLGYDIPKGKIKSGCAGFKSAEWRTWVVALSPILLKGRLLGDHWKVHLLFVGANRILAKPSLSIDEINEGHKKLQQFCMLYERLYGPDEITPNMHLHMHLRETMLDFGPMYAFWLFGFERFNGILKAIDTNGKDGLEITMMRHFLQKHHAGDYLHTMIANLERHPFLKSVIMALVLSLYTASSEPQDNDDELFNLNEFNRFSENPMLVDAVLGYEALPPSLITSIQLSDKHWVDNLVVVIPLPCKTVG